MLNLEILMGCLCVLFLLSFTFIAKYIEMVDWVRSILILYGFFICLIAVLVALKIEQIAGFYECAKCKHRYVTTYKQVSLAMHIGRTRHMKYPYCNCKP